MGNTSKRILNLRPLPRHRPIQLSLHFKEAGIHFRVFREIRVLQENIWKRFVF